MDRTTPAPVPRSTECPMRSHHISSALPTAACCEILASIPRGWRVMSDESQASALAVVGPRGGWHSSMFHHAPMGWHGAMGSPVAMPMQAPFIMSRCASRPRSEGFFSQVLLVSPDDQRGTTPGLRPRPRAAAAAAAVAAAAARGRQRDSTAWWAPAAPASARARAHVEPPR